MPYITKAKRERIDWVIDNLDAVMDNIGMEGTLNYILFRLAKKRCRRYKDFAALIGELEAAKLEIYRRLTAKHEDNAIVANGDVE